MYLTCREAGGGSVATESNTVTFFGTDGVTTGTFKLDGLKQKTSYDVIVESVDDEGNVDEYTSFSFTTPADDRVLEVNNINPYMILFILFIIEIIFHPHNRNILRNHIPFHKLPPLEQMLKLNSLLKKL